MGQRFLAAMAVACAMFATDAQAWLCQCNPDDLKRCHKACSNAGGTIVKDSKGREWCNIPSRITDPNDPRVKILKEGGMDWRKGRDRLE